MSSPRSGIRSSPRVRRRAKQALQMKKAPILSNQGFLNKILAVSYSHMGRPHTTIGAERFHFRVRNGIGWFPLAIAARKTGIAFSNLKISDNLEFIFVSHYMSHCMLWCYMAKPHVQLVLVSFIHY